MEEDRRQAARRPREREDAEKVVKTGLTLSREYVILGTQTEKELKEANEVGSLAGDVSELIVGLVGK